MIDDFSPTGPRKDPGSEQPSSNPGFVVFPNRQPTPDTEVFDFSSTTTEPIRDPLLDPASVPREFTPLPPLENDTVGIDPNKPPKRRRRSFGAWFKDLKAWKKVLLILTIVALLAGGAAAAYFLTQEKDQPKKEPAKQTATVEEPTTVANTLTGRQVDPEVNKVPVTAVMIENSMDARPQSGLYDAGVVFEAIAEGGITRFLTLFQDTEPTSVGPVRSVRPYYLEWALGFDASVAHVGGSAEALQNIKQWNVKDLDQSSNAGSFDRVSSRYAPHNVYTSIERLQALEAKKGFTTTDFNGFGRKKEAAAATPTASTIDINISSANYRSGYTYDKATNSYLRNLAGVPHTDELAGKQINPKVVIGLVTDYSIAANGIHSIYRTTGSGQAYIFQDGIVTIGTWTKSSRTTQLSFTDADGKALGLNPGQTWITAVNSASKITYQP